MPDISKGMTDRKLSEIFDWLKRSDLALPELQRPAVWADAKIPCLLESVYRDYPFGVMLIWTPKPGSQIHCRDFEFEETRESNPPRVAKHYLIDGQQRLTSFYRALHDDGNVPQDWSVQVAFNVRDEEFSLIDATMRSMLASPREHGCYRLRMLLKMGPDDLARLRREQNQVDLNDEEFRAIFGPDGRLWRLLPQNISIGVYNIHERSYGEVVEIFDRINQGTPVRESQIVLGHLSEFNPGIVGPVEAYLAESRVKHGRGFDLDFFIGAMAVLRRGYAEIEVLPRHYGWEYDEDAVEIRSGVQKDVERTKMALDCAFEFMNDHLKMDTLKYIRSPRTMICLAYLLEKFPACRGNNREAREVASWVAQALLIGYHGGEARFKQDIGAVRESGTVPLDDFKKNLRRQAVKTEIKSIYERLDDMDYSISRGDPLFTFLYAMLRWKGALSFPSRRPIQAVRVIDNDGREDDESEARPIAGVVLHEHHIYPIARLQQEFDGAEDGWFEKPWINDIANITFILGDDNFSIGDSSIQYLDDIDPEIRAQHMIGRRRYRTGDYRQFVEDRRNMIKRSLGEFLQRLEQQAKDE
jgi:hypothetical protein